MVWPMSVRRTAASRALAKYWRVVPSASRSVTRVPSTADTVARDGAGVGRALVFQVIVTLALGCTEGGGWSGILQV